mmetsp:Transcript_170336/g.540989  ORF Transcript_170336/g.540989 Transcript_170336/m.540989 type:complete len:351 (-) Transcript_170336:85-1137(-)
MVLAASDGKKLDDLLSKLSLFPPTGNVEKDSDSTAKHNILKNMIRGCLRDQSFILPMLSAYEEHEKKIIQDRAISAKRDEKFQRTSTFGKLDESFAITFVVQRSDLTSKDLSEAVKHDPETLVELVEFETQLAPSIKMLDKLQVIEVCPPFMAARGDANGVPLRDFKHSGGLLPSGQVNWRRGAYTLIFTDKKLTALTFRNGDQVVVGGESGVNDDWVLIRNCSDWRCAMERKPFPEIKLPLFFEKDKTGPYRLAKHLSTRAREYSQAVDAAYNAWDAAQKANGAKPEIEGEIAAAKGAILALRTQKKTAAAREGQGHCQGDFEGQEGQGEHFHEGRRSPGALSGNFSTF